MAVSNTTRTHLIYQFIILTLLFLSIGYNELLPDRKFILFLVFIPIFCYQLVVLSCCLDSMSLPRVMRFLESSVKKWYSNLDESNHDCTKSFSTSRTLVSSGVQTKKKFTFPDISEMPLQRRWEKSVTNLGASPKYLTKQQKAKSWISLDDSSKSSERLLSREGSLDVLSPLPGMKCSLRGSNKDDKIRSREERAKKAKSWKPCETNSNVSTNALTKTSSLSIQSTEPSIPNYAEAPQEETELSKSYSFPFRQKRLETWLEMKDTSMGQSNRSLDMPYWQSVGYNLAVKYEARRRRRAFSNSHSEFSEEPAFVMQKSIEVVSDAAHRDKQSGKKGAKSTSTCINKIKVGLSNLMSKKKEEVLENSNGSFNKAAKCNLLQKLINKNTCPTKEKNEVNMPEFPQFLSNDRPLIFYPKYLPFEKDRFETDVRKKMKELDDEMKTKCTT